MTGLSDFKRGALIRAFKLLHVLLAAAVFGLCLRLFFTDSADNFWSPKLIMFLSCYVVVLMFAMRTYHAYNLGMSKVSMLVFSQTLAEIVASAMLYFFLLIDLAVFPAVYPFLLILAVQLALNCLWSILANRIYYTLYRPWKTVVVSQSMQELQRLHMFFDIKKKFDVQTILTIEEAEHQLDTLDAYEAVIQINVPTDLRNRILQTCVTAGIRSYVTPTVGDILMRGADHLELFSVPVFRVIRSTPNAEYVAVKRLIDIVGALLGIVLLSPIMAVTALAIRAYDHGPAFYRQVRLTKDGKTFEILKFRSMRVDAESDGVARLATEGDSRITPVGAFIRACRIDELPQLFNILKGEMSIVGPRPERPEIARQYEQVLPAFSLRLQVKAGLTGFAQVYGRYNTEPQDKLLMDLMYVNRMSLLEDVKLILATIRILFLKESTQGTAQGQVTAMYETSGSTNDHAAV